eukprot:PRCOL_00005437-RA
MPRPARSVARAEELLKSLEGIDRGAAASEEQAANVDALAAALEALNPTDDPLSSARLNGQWELLYTTSASILGTSKPKWLRPWGKILQALDAGSLRAENLEGAPLFNAVRAKLTPRGADDIVDVQFDTFRLAGFLKVKAPERARGWLKITYLDDDLRVCRGDKGNLFVLSMHERDYSLPAEGW